MKLRIVGSVTVLAICFLSRPVFAQDACTPNVKIHNFSDPPETGNWYTVGRFLLFGAFVTAACVENIQTHATTMHLITTMNDYPLESLPFSDTNLCLTSDHDFVEILQESRTACGAVMHPIVYGGNRFNISALEGNDYLLGGNGKETLFGGSGNDILSDSSPGTPGENPIHIGSLRGGAGHDRIVGSMGTTTLWGDSGDDGLWDHGGVDELRGGDGHECCMYDSFNASIFDCGSGEDTVQTMHPSRAQGGQCEVITDQCNAGWQSGPNCGIWFGPFDSI